MAAITITMIVISETWRQNDHLKCHCPLHSDEKICSVKESFWAFKCEASNYDTALVRNRKIRDLILVRRYDSNNETLARW